MDAINASANLTNSLTDLGLAFQIGAREINLHSQEISSNQSASSAALVRSDAISEAGSKSNSTSSGIDLLA